MKCLRSSQSWISAFRFGTVEESHVSDEKKCCTLHGFPQTRGIVRVQHL